MMTILNKTGRIGVFRPFSRTRSHNWGGGSFRVPYLMLLSIFLIHMHRYTGRMVSLSSSKHQLFQMNPRDALFHDIVLHGRKRTISVIN